jgi:hypothetical protein
LLHLGPAYAAAFASKKSNIGPIFHTDFGPIFCEGFDSRLRLVAFGSVWLFAEAERLGTGKALVRFQ